MSTTRMRSRESYFKLLSIDVIYFCIALLLVATGSIVGDFADLTEVLDLNDAGNKCLSKFDFPFGAMDSNGVLLNQSSPLFCGGYVRSNIGLEPQVSSKSAQVYNKCNK